MEPQLSDSLTLALHIDRLMRRIHVDLHPKAVKADDAKVGPLGGMVLMTIEENAPISLQELGKALARDKGQMTRVVQMLESKGLLVRTACPEDRRVWLIRLTDTGQALVAAFRSALAEVVEEMLLCVSQEERTQLLNTLKKLLASPAETGPGPDADA